MEVCMMYVYHENEIRQIDKQAVAQGLSMYTLMENAGSGLFQHIQSLLNENDRILILAGKGNNGGDGIVLARYLKMHGYQVTLTFPLGEPKTKVAKEHLRYYESQGFSVDLWNQEQTYDVIIDSLLGIGTKLPLHKNIQEIITWCNQKDALKISIDLPTGVQADHGKVDEAIIADYTFCLHGYKPAAFLLPASQFFGNIQVVDIGLKQTSNIRLLTKTDVQKTWPLRQQAGHKGTFGTSLLIAGTDHMPGSALLAGIGAIRTGTGKLTIATTTKVASMITPRVPEATFLLNGLQKIANGVIPEKVAAIGIGPGLDDQQQVISALQTLNETDLPLVIDAGGLIPLEQWKQKNNRKQPIVITPHPGEFSRLTNKSIEDIQANRITLANNYAKTHGITVVLKGQYTVIAFPHGEVRINPTGNNALAKGGSGDVLTGMIVSMLTTHNHWQDAVNNAVYLHGLCGDVWVEHNSSASMVASDFDQLLPTVIRSIETNTNIQ